MAQRALGASFSCAPIHSMLKRQSPKSEKIATFMHLSGLSLRLSIRICLLVGADKAVSDIQPPGGQRPNYEHDCHPWTPWFVRPTWGLPVSQRRSNEIYRTALHPWCWITGHSGPLVFLANREPVRGGQHTRTHTHTLGDISQPRPTT